MTVDSGRCRAGFSWRRRLAGGFANLRTSKNAGGTPAPQYISFSFTKGAFLEVFVSRFLRRELPWTGRHSRGDIEYFGDELIRSQAGLIVVHDGDNH
jgi:hypothetical protein